MQINFKKNTLALFNIHNWLKAFHEGLPCYIEYISFFKFNPAQPSSPTFFWLASSVDRVITSFVLC